MTSIATDRSDGDRGAGDREGGDQFSSAGSGDAGTRPTRADRSARWALWTFVAVLVVAVPVLFYRGREQWFFLDEWDFLAGRDLRDVGDLFRPHNEHWTTIPIVLYRLVFRVVGLNHYWPYLALAIGSHLAVASLLRAVIRRSGAGPWIATAAATLMVFLGSGRANILWGFQVTFTGAVAFGLAHLLLADHDGPLNRRDAAGVACGLAALMCSGIGVGMVAGVGASVLVRRGWKLAAAHTVPLAVAYGLWYGWQRPNSDSGTPFQAVSFAWEMVRNAFVQFSRGPWWAVLLSAAVAVGAVLYLRRTPLRRDSRVPAPLVGVMVAALTSVVVIAVGRSASFLPGLAATDRYVYLIIALSLPAIAVAATALADDRRWARALVIVALLALLPGNVRALRATGLDRLTLGNPDGFEQVAGLAQSGSYDPASHPIPWTADAVTVGWLRATVAEGRTSVRPVTDPSIRANVVLATSLLPDDRAVSTTCQSHPQSESFLVHKGQHLAMDQTFVTVTQFVDKQPAATVTLYEPEGISKTVLGGQKRIQITSAADPDAPIMVCG